MSNTEHSSGGIRLWIITAVLAAIIIVPLLLLATNPHILPAVGH